MAEISGADLPFFTYFEDEEIRIILNELFTFYDGEATTEEKRLIEKWMPFIAKDRNSAMEFSLLVAKQNSRIDRTYLTNVT